MSHTVGWRIVVAGSILLLAACPDRPISKVDPVQTGQITRDVPVSADVDILFVIDNSSSTSDKQLLFAQNFSNFVSAIDTFPTGRPNLHIGVVTTTVDVGVGGYFSDGAGCPTLTSQPNSATLQYNGLLRTIPVDSSCAGSLPNDGSRFFSDIATSPTSRTTNYAGDLASALTCVAQVNDNGCGFEAPLEAMKRALDPTINPQNAGFLRDGAALAVIILTEADDASISDKSILSPMLHSDFALQPGNAYKCDQPVINATTPGTYTNCVVRTPDNSPAGGIQSKLADPSSYFDFLTSIKDPSQLIVALIAGDPQYPAPAATNTVVTDFAAVQGSNVLELAPSCHAMINGKDAVARPSIRLNDFLSNFGDHGLFATVCQTSYANVLTDIGTLLFKAVSPCLEGSIDVTDIDSANPGTQIDCSVVDVVGINSMTPQSTELPVCEMMGDGVTAIAPANHGSCWYIKLDDATCPLQDGSTTTRGPSLQFVRGTTPAPGTNTQINCATTAN